MLQDEQCKECENMDTCADGITCMLLYPKIIDGHCNSFEEKQPEE